MRGLLQALGSTALCALALSVVVAPLIWATLDAGALGESVRVMTGLAVGLTWALAALFAVASLTWWLLSIVVSGRDALEEELVVRERQRVLTLAELRGALYLPEDTLEGALSLESPAP